MISIAPDVKMDIGFRAATLKDTLNKPRTKDLPGYSAYEHALKSRIMSSTSNGAAATEGMRETAAAGTAHPERS